MNFRQRFFDAFGARLRPSADPIVRSSVSPNESKRVRETLATTQSTELKDHELRTLVEGNLWMLTPEAFLYFLPAFLQASLQSYAALSVFASELLGALTEPSGGDVAEAFDRLTRPPAGLGLPVEVRGRLPQHKTSHPGSTRAQYASSVRFHAGRSMQRARYVRTCSYGFRSA